MLIGPPRHVAVRLLFPCFCAGNWSLKCAGCNCSYDFRFQTTCEGATEGGREAVGQTEIEADREDLLADVQQ